MWWFIPVISATWEGEIRRRSVLSVWPQAKSRRPYLKNN
jgi:hypothetical protein